ncbi:hypothetical protein KIM372_15970 [Bombiscardovia nodaiensis]|uniref:Zinc-ribbon domain-containing protein n=1 Tax=Bombiscardovia nodaiensis TaxID=2932181 RepID=A0ABN6SGI6_9BIFI|nr:hypothetical protein KIM372_15970 [Bombiscardovia nodaiensis]
MTCANCGSPLNNGANFCPACGAPVQSVAPAQPVSNEQPTDVVQPTNVAQAQPVVQVQSNPEPSQPEETYSQSSQTPAATSTVETKKESKPKKKSHFWWWVAAAVVVVFLLSRGFIGKGGVSSGSSPVSVDDFAAYIENKNYTPNPGNSALLQIIGDDISDKSWVGTGDGVYDAQVVCGSDHYRIRYATSGSAKGWQLYQLNTPVYKSIQEDLPKCAVE